MGAAVSRADLDAAIDAACASLPPDVVRECSRECGWTTDRPLMPTRHEAAEFLAELRRAIVLRAPTPRRDAYMAARVRL